MAQWVTVMRADKAAGRSSGNCGVDQRSTWRGGEMVAPHALDNRWPHRGGRLGDASIRCNDLVFPLHDHHYDLDTGISRYDPLTPSELVMRREGLRGAVRAKPAASRAGIPSLVSCRLGINDQPTPGSTVSPACGTSTATYLLIPACWPTGPVLASRSQRANA